MFQGAAPRETVGQILARELGLRSEVATGLPLGDQLDSLQMAQAAAILCEIGLDVHGFRLPDCSPAELDDRMELLGIPFPRVVQVAGRDRLARPRPLDSDGADRPARRSANIQLDPVTPETFPFLYALAVDEEVGYRWRFRGSVPSPETFQNTFWQGTLVQFVVTMTGAAEPIGHVVCYGHDAGHQYAFVGLVFAPPVLGTGLPLEAASCFLNYLFGTWNLRKVYFEVPEFNFPQFASGAGHYFHEEGRLRQHEFYAGRFWDKLYLAVYRDDVVPSREGRTIGRQLASEPIDPRPGMDGSG
jgi:RimJ/RimL family protein N-acetyltransferase